MSRLRANGVQAHNPEGLCACLLYGGIFMEAVFDYNIVLNQAAQKIRDIRAPRSIPAFHRDARMQIMEEETIFDFGGHDYDT